MSSQNFGRGGRNSRAGYSPSMGAADPRLRRNAVAGRTGDDLGDMMTLDAQGRIIPDIDESTGLVRLPNGKLGIDHAQFAASTPANVTFNTTSIGGGSGGSGGTTIINNYTVDEVLPWIDW